MGYKDFLPFQGAFMSGFLTGFISKLTRSNSMDSVESRGRAGSVDSAVSVSDSEQVSESTWNPLKTQTETLVKEARVEFLAGWATKVANLNISDMPAFPTLSKSDSIDNKASQLEKHLKICLSKYKDYEAGFFAIVTGAQNG